MIADLVPRVRAALSVDSSYDADIIPFGIQRQITRLLRDYHFPWAVLKETYTGLTANQQSYELPTGFKKELLVNFYDTVDDTYTDPLLKVEGFILPPVDNAPKKYWLAGNELFTDIKLQAADTSTTNLILWYESLDWAANETWITSRFEDMIFTLSVFRLATEQSKSELAQLYAQLWADDRQSLAIYLNELEFDNGIYEQRPASYVVSDRYPAN